MRTPEVEGAGKGGNRGLGIGGSGGGWKRLRGFGSAGTSEGGSGGEGKGQRISSDEESADGEGRLHFAPSGAEWGNDRTRGNSE